MATNEHHPDDWLSRREAASYAGVSIATLDRAIKAGRLKAKKLEGRVVIQRQWGDTWLLAALAALALVAIAVLTSFVLGLLDFDQARHILHHHHRVMALHTHLRG